MINEHIHRYGHLGPATMTRAAFSAVCDAVASGPREDPDEDEEQLENSEGEDEEQEEEGQLENAEEEDEEQDEEREEEREEEQEREREEEREEEQEEEDEHEEEQEDPGYDDNDFAKDPHSEEDEDGDDAGFKERLYVRDMDPTPKGVFIRPEMSNDIFFSAPTARPSKLSQRLAELGPLTPTESDISGSNYSENNPISEDTPYEENEEDFVGEGESPKEARSGRGRTRGRKPCRELREISRHIVDRHAQAVREVATQFNVPESMVRTLGMEEFKPSRDTGNTWNDYQTWKKLVDPLREGESGMFFF